ncbi:MAG: zinc-binding dehydrogenase [Dehalococcoidales bacterium]|nr:zinc-binding dehydrogenase [Dehalococcoidales bacterium]
MKAVVTTGKKRGIVIKDIPKPQVRTGTLLLKTKCCSICGSDLEYVDGSFEWRGTAGELHAGAILGHEFCAEVTEIGEGVEGWSIGDRATLGGVRQGCGQCYYCRRRLFHLCMGGRKRALFYNETTPGGYGSKFGAMTEYFVRPPSSLQKVPDNVSDAEAALVEPLSNGVGAARAAELKPGDSAVIIGAGKIGLGAMLAAKVAGASPVIVVDMVKSRLDKALEMGADAVINAKEVDVISKVVNLTEEGPDAVIICVRDGEVLNQAIDIVRRGGIIVLVGNVPPTEVNPGLWYIKNLRFIGILGFSPLSIPMNLIAHKQVNVMPMISEIVPIEEAQRAFDSMYSGENIVVLLKP